MFIYIIDSIYLLLIFLVQVIKHCMRDCAIITGKEGGGGGLKNG